MRVVPEAKRLVQVGQKCGRWTVIGESFYVTQYYGQYKSIRQFSVVECECGTIRALESKDLRSLHSKSCGCLKAELTAERGRKRTGRNSSNFQHGCTNSRLHKIWRGMLSRCKSPREKRYFGRGITVCDEWKDFVAFQDWSMSNGHDPSLSLDRIDNDRGYSPENCRWTTSKVQSRNMSRNVNLTAFGETKSIAAWADDARCVVSKYTLRGRISDCGWNIELALTSPTHSVYGKQRKDANHAKNPDQPA